LTINSLHSAVVGGDKTAEIELFQLLTARFRLFVQQKIWDRQDAEEVVQDALLTVAEKYKGIEFETSFAAWAHKVLSNKVLHYFRTRAGHERRFVGLEEGSSPAKADSLDSDLETRLLDCLRKIIVVNNRFARILNFHYQGYAVAEVCERLRLTRTNFYSILSRARSMLELCLEKGDLR
jgi:RNA polymerase sigma factor (sigma-70 family)